MERTEIITPEHFDAVLFDLDGVLTSTAELHANSWKRMFDDYLRQRAEEEGEEYRPFDIVADYKAYVDGKLRYDGVRSFLESRGIELPEGDPNDPPERETICGLGNRKDVMVKKALDEDGVKVFEGSVRLVHHLRDLGLKLAVVSASKNCQAVLEAAGIDDLFEERVDGVVAAEHDLRGKPAPDTFLEGARRLGVDPQRTVVFEDAVSGVQAGRAGGFGLVVGVAQDDDGAILKQNGADIVVKDLAELLE